ncbi:TadE/TadG family type IV pilus assembly protein [Isoptericola sp. NPDC056618]|uniref:TadE/TadG family type IV pilus assembly protein n=1 Tax=Isoptericola sp. NPDC056618 TaxID=3345878 RepID=UPI0036A02EAA
MTGSRRRCHVSRGWLEDGERGSAAIEAVIGVPAFVLFVGLVIVGGRIAIAHQAVQAVAADAARAASIARTVDDAQAAAAQGMSAGLANQELRCAATHLTLDTTGLASPPGVAGTVTATVSCTVDLADVSVPGVPGAHTVIATMTSPVDAWRADP